MRMFGLLRQVASLVLGIGVLAPGAAMAQIAVLESTSLRLEVNGGPYSYVLREKATNNVLVTESQTQFTVGSVRTVTGATVTAQTATTLDATLALSGTSETAHVTFTLTTPDILQVKLSYDNGTPTNIKEQFVDAGERNYGIWEYSYWGTGGALDNRGANNRNLVGASGPPQGSGDPSARAPFYWTNKKYGVYVDNIDLGRYTIGLSGQTSFNFDTAQMTYYVIYGTSPSWIMSRYSALADGSLMPPNWAFDPVFWRDDHHQDLAANGVANAQALVLKDADQLQAFQMPSGGMFIDRPVGTGTGALVGWGNMDFDTAATGFPDPAAMIANLKARGMNLNVWITNRDQNLMTTDPELNPFRFTGAGCSVAGCTTTPGIDLRNPIPYNRFKKVLQTGYPSQSSSYISMGITGFKIDRGDQGDIPDSLQPLHAYLIPKMAYEASFEYNGAEGYTFSRNVYDRGRKYVGVWTGDAAVTFAGMSDALKQMVRLGNIMISMVGSDTGGYNSATPKELFARWIAMNAHVPYMEILLGPNRTPWNPPFTTGANATPPLLTTIFTKWTQEHHDMIPYTRTWLKYATQYGVPVVRPLPMVFPDDPAVADMFNQYMFGDSLMVAPVLTTGATSRSVYLPAGGWIDYNDKITKTAGPTTVTAAAPLDVIPRFVKAGAIIPRGDIQKSNNNWTPNWTPNLHIEYFPAQGVTSAFDYFNGTLPVQMRGTRSGNTVSLKFANPGINGKVEVYTVPAIASVVRNGQVLTAGTDYQYDAALQRLTVPYTGATTLTVTLSST